MFVLNRTIEHVVTAFNLPTEYFIEGQEHITDDDLKDKVKVDPKKAIATDFSVVQLEDIVGNWMKYTKKIMKSLQTKVSRKY